MSNWVDPEWLPSVPANDRGPFHCYVLWAGDTRQYYVGHTSDPESRIEEHFDGMVMTTAILTVPTDDDTVDEINGSITATLLAPTNTAVDDYNYAIGEYLAHPWQLPPSPRA